MSLSWIIENNSLALRSSEGSVIPVDAFAIYKSVFSGETINVGGINAPSIRDELPDISFSKYPANPCLHASLIDGRICIRLCVDIKNSPVPIKLGSDQILVNTKWYPVENDAIKYFTDRLASENIVLDAPITLGHLIKLRGIKDNLPLYEDPEINFDAPDAKSVVPCSEIEGLNAKLYPYQQSGVSFLRLIADQSIGCILADEMGLGKTLQVIALLQQEKLSDRNQSLIVAPATLLENWRREINLFAPSLKVFIHAGQNRPGIPEKLKGIDVVLVSYETAIRDEPLLSLISWNILVLDEAQNIKNPEAQRTVAVKSLPRRVSIAVSGTPMENKLDDLWSLSDFSLPGLLGRLNDFQENFSDQHDDANRLAPIVAPIILRRKVLDVAQDLPEKIEIPQPILMTNKLAEAYESLRIDTLEEYGRAASMVATTRLRVLCAHPKLSIDWSDDPAFEMPKYQRTVELFEEIFSKDEKVLLFTTYQGMVDIFMDDSAKRWPKAYLNFIDGRVPVESRQPIIDEFFKHEGYGVLFLNPKAAGAGLNITAANHVIHYNPEWNPALTEQASRRSYRRKQEKPVTIHHLYFANTLEEVITERAHFKRELAENAVTGHDGSVDTSVISEALNISPLNHSTQE